MLLDTVRFEVSGVMVQSQMAGTAAFKLCPFPVIACEFVYHLRGPFCLLKTVELGTRHLLLQQGYLGK